jgi:hypothetical protein
MHGFDDFPVMAPALKKRNARLAIDNFRPAPADGARVEGRCGIVVQSAQQPNHFPR